MAKLKAAQEGKQTYLDRLQKSDDQVKSEGVLFTVEQKELQLKSDILATKRALGEKTKQREHHLNSTNLDFTNLSTLDDEIEGLQKGLERLEGYEAELF